MSRLKTFAIYVLIIVSFYIFSNILIFLGINTTYGNMQKKGTIPEKIDISIATSTLVNGEIRGTVLDDDDISDKYIRFNFYNDNGNLAGVKYIKISDLKNDEFEFYFRLHYIKSYSVEIVDEAQDDYINMYDEFFSYEEYKKYKIVYWFLVLAFM